MRRVKKKRENLSAELLAILGKDGLCELLEHYAGTRLYVPKMNGEASTVIPHLTRATSLKLSERYGTDYLVVPLMREFRAICLRQQGLAIEKIARRLGMTARGVERIFERLRENRSANGKPLSEHQRNLIEVASS